MPAAAPIPPAPDDGYRHWLRYEPLRGVDIDEAAAARYPCSAASLPVARKLDGTLHYW
jgi:mannonate dehydratase